MKNANCSLNNKELKIDIENVFSIDDSAWFTENVVANFPEIESCKVNLTEIERIDLPALQMLYVLKTNCENSNKRFDISFSFNQDSLELIKKCGFQYIFNIE